MGCLVLAAWSTDLEDGSGGQAEERGAPRIGPFTATRRGKAQRALGSLSMVFRGGGDCGDLAVLEIYVAHGVPIEHLLSLTRRLSASLTREFLQRLPRPVP